MLNVEENRTKRFKLKHASFPTLSLTLCASACNDFIAFFFKLSNMHTINSPFKHAHTKCVPSSSPSFTSIYIFLNFTCRCIKFPMPDKPLYFCNSTVFALPQPVEQHFCAHLAQPLASIQSSGLNISVRLWFRTIETKKGAFSSTPPSHKPNGTLPEDESIVDSRSSPQRSCICAQMPLSLYMSKQLYWSSSSLLAKNVQLRRQ